MAFQLGPGLRIPRGMIQLTDFVQGTTGIIGFPLRGQIGHGGIAIVSPRQPCGARHVPERIPMQMGFGIAVFGIAPALVTIILDSFFGHLSGAMKEQPCGNEAIALLQIQFHLVGFGLGPYPGIDFLERTGGHLGPFLFLALRIFRNGGYQIQDIILGHASILRSILSNGLVGIMSPFGTMRSFGNNHTASMLGGIIIQGQPNIDAILISGGLLRGGGDKGFGPKGLIIHMPIARGISGDILGQKDIAQQSQTLRLGIQFHELRTNVR
mmetsp:Transcript_20582/g.43126  ORF Transcript_20582/g.43126 Transcript_20582/m.43126 type:complete len:268 (-) Transcript_20582:754-1557(-)